MKINTNHPTIIQFVENVTNSVIVNVPTQEYFSMSPEKKNTIQYLVFKLIKEAIKLRVSFNDTETVEFLKILNKKTEEIENYELSQVLNDIINNYETINKSTIITKKSTVRNTLRKRKEY